MERRAILSQRVVEVVHGAATGTHAGTGMWNNTASGNSRTIGLAAESAGIANGFPWAEVRIGAGQSGGVAILRHVRSDMHRSAGHGEHALPAGRMPDPSLNVGVFRWGVAARMAGNG